MLMTAGRLSAQNKPRNVPPALGSLMPEEVNSLFMPAGMAGPALVNGVPQILYMLMHGPQSGTADVNCQGPPEPTTVPRPLPTREQAAVDDAARFDLIALGTPERPRTYILPNGGFLYSLMKFQVEDIIKNNPGAPVQPGDLITIGREGGILYTNKVTLRAWCTDYRLFQTGAEYVLYLQYNPKAGIYIPSRYGYEFVSGKTIGLGPHGRDHSTLSGPPIVGMNKSDFISMEKDGALRAQERGGKP